MRNNGRSVVSVPASSVVLDKALWWVELSSVFFGKGGRGKVGNRNSQIRFEQKGLTGASSVPYLQVDLIVILCGKFSFGIPQGSFCSDPQCTLFVNSKRKSRKVLTF